MKLTDAQLNMLRFIEKRDYPAGEPRISWLNTRTYTVLKRHELVEERFADIVHLTHAGRAALAQGGGE